MKRMEEKKLAEQPVHLDYRGELSKLPFSWNSPL